MRNTFQYDNYILIKEYEKDEACTCTGKIRNAYRIVVGKPEGKGPLGGRRTREDSITVDLNSNKV
jgi:hypothetical protein